MSRFGLIWKSWIGCPHGCDGRYAASTADEVATLRRCNGSLAKLLEMPGC